MLFYTLAKVLRLMLMLMLLILQLEKDPLTHIKQHIARMISAFMSLRFKKIIKKLGYENTVPIDRILSVKNARAWVSMDFT